MPQAVRQNRYIFNWWLQKEQPTSIMNELFDCDQFKHKELQSLSLYPQLFAF